jgi:hypothetical protein
MQNGGMPMANNARKLNYFEFKGKRYPVGSVVKITEKEMKRIGANYPYITILNHYVNSNGTHSCLILKSYNNWNGMQSCEMSTFFNNFEDIVEEITLLPTKQAGNRYKDTEVDVMLYGWLNYILVMLVSVIFKGFIFIWIIASIVFWTWRKRKLNY